MLYLRTSFVNVCKANSVADDMSSSRNIHSSRDPYERWLQRTCYAFQLPIAGRENALGTDSTWLVPIQSSCHLPLNQGTRLGELRLKEGWKGTALNYSPVPEWIVALSHSDPAIHKKYCAFQSPIRGCGSMSTRHSV